MSLQFYLVLDPLSFGPIADQHFPYASRVYHILQRLHVDSPILKYHHCYFSIFFALTYVLLAERQETQGAF